MRERDVEGKYVRVPTIVSMGSDLISFLELPTGESVIIDRSDTQRVLEGSWYIADGSVIGIVDGEKVRLSRFITEATDGIVRVVNGDQLDMRKSNLIEDDDRTEIARGGSLRKDNVSGYKGVSWNKRKHSWEVRLKVGTKYMFLGLYKDLNDAVSVREQAEEKYWRD